MGRIKIRYLVAKPQAGGHCLYYWQPSRTLQKLGFLTRRLAESTNRLEDAVAEAERLNRELDAWRAGKGEPTIEPGTLPWLIKSYKTTERFKDLADSSQAAYGHAIRIIEAWSVRHEHPPIAGMKPHHVREFLDTITKPGMRLLCYRVLRVLMAFAVDEGHVDKNPARGLRMKNTPPRSTYWTPAQVDAIVAKARETGRESVALAVMLAVSLGQRQGDILALAWANFDGAAFVLRQRKTKRQVSVPPTAELRDILATASRKAPTIVISEVTGRPYTRNGFAHAFLAARKAAGLPAALRFHDLRRTAVVRLAEAGCSVPEIAAVTGHSIDRTARILEVYLPRTAPVARAAIARLDEARARTKEARKLEG